MSEWILLALRMILANHMPMITKQDIIDKHNALIKEAEARNSSFGIVRYVLDGLKQWLRLMGLEIIGTGADKKVYSHDELDFVVKVGYISNLKKDLEAPKEWMFFGEYYDFVEIQPKVKVFQTEKAVRLIRELYGACLPEYDIHVDNVGWHDGKPVAFDW